MIGRAMRNAAKEKLRGKQKKKRSSCNPDSPIPRAFHGTVVSWSGNTITLRVKSEKEHPAEARVDFEEQIDETLGKITEAAREPFERMVGESLALAFEELANPKVIAAAVRRQAREKLEHEIRELINAPEFEARIAEALHPQKEKILDLVFATLVKDMKQKPDKLARQVRTAANGMLVQTMDQYVMASIRQTYDYGRTTFSHKLDGILAGQVEGLFQRMRDAQEVEKTLTEARADDE